MISLILIASLTMSTMLTFESSDHSFLTPDEISWAREQCQRANLERLDVNKLEINGVINTRKIRCWSLNDPTVDITS